VKVRPNDGKLPEYCHLVQFDTVLSPTRENIALCKVFASIGEALRCETLTNTLQNYVHRILKGTEMLHAS